jgi:hypothetical protein
MERHGFTATRIGDVLKEVEMARLLRSKVLPGILSTLLVVSGASEVGIPVAHAQFPIFSGGEVLTPFGQRGSDGSYLTPYARRLAAKEKAARAKKQAAHRVAVPPSSGGLRGWFRRSPSR